MFRYGSGCWRLNDCVNGVGIWLDASWLAVAVWAELPKGTTRAVATAVAPTAPNFRKSRRLKPCRVLVMMVLREGRWSQVAGVESPGAVALPASTAGCACDLGDSLDGPAAGQPCTSSTTATTTP